VGRPWWYDNYWEKRNPRRRFQLPRRPLWIWTAIVLLSLILTGSNSGFNLSVIGWIIGFVYYLCRILSFTIFVRAILSWFTVSHYNLLVMLLDDVVRPILSPLRRIVPRVGLFDITPLVAIALLYVIPVILRAILL
jgi:YggT family protein